MTRVFYKPLNGYPSIASVKLMEPQIFVERHAMQDFITHIQTTYKKGKREASRQKKNRKELQNRSNDLHPT